MRIATSEEQAKLAAMGLEAVARLEAYARGELPGLDDAQLSAAVGRLLVSIVMVAGNDVAWMNRLALAHGIGVAFGEVCGQWAGQDGVALKECLERGFEEGHAAGLAIFAPRGIRMSLAPAAVMAAHAPAAVEADSALQALHRKLEFFPTPPWAARAGGELIQRLDPGPWFCWEPACGQGHMAHGLADYFPTVLATDIHAHGWAGQGAVLDFLNPDPDLLPADPVDWIVTNPPFGRASAFVEAGLRRARRGVAILARLALMESAGRYELFFPLEASERRVGLSVLAPFFERVPMTLGRWEPRAATATAYAWFVWMQPVAWPSPWHGAPKVYPIPPGSKARLTRPDDARVFGAKGAAPLLESRAVKVRPILFSGPMVRALLEGRKTQTRRVVKPQPHIDTQGNFNVGSLNYGQHPDGRPYTRSFADWRCPYGKVGDRLWVRETWQVVRETLDYETGGEYDVFSWDDVYGSAKDYLHGDARCGISARVFYAADGEGENPSAFYDLIGLKGEVLREREIRWRPSIHMPRWASRLTLEVVSVRVELLNDISEADAAAEGLIKLPASGRYVVARGDQYFGGASPHAVEAYSWLWEEINGGGSWATNPWVWVVEFKVVMP